MDSLLLGNQLFQQTHVVERTNLTKSQNPTTFILCCSDSRTDPAIITQNFKLGELFVIRNAGHIPDASTIETLQYGLANFPPEQIVVLGHSGCGAVTAVYQKNPQYPTIAQHVSPSICRLFSEDESNIAQSIINHIHRTAEILRKLFPEVIIYGWYYNIESGKLMTVK